MININNTRLRAALVEAGLWSRRIAILIFVFLGIMILPFLFFMISLGPQLISEVGIEFAGIGLVSILLIVGVFGLYFYLTLKLYKFGKAFQLPAGSNLTNERIEEGFQHLGTLYKTFVLLIIGMFLFIVLAFVFMDMLG